MLGSRPAGFFWRHDVAVENKNDTPPAMGEGPAAAEVRDILRQMIRMVARRIADDLLRGRRAGPGDVRVGSTDITARTRRTTRTTRRSPKDVGGN
jgi:hypothetical protein